MPVDLIQAIAIALESIYDPERKYGLPFWYRSVEKGGCTKTMLCEAFKQLGDNPGSFVW